MKNTHGRIICGQPATLQDMLSKAMDVSRKRAKAVIDRRGVLVNNRRVWMARHALKTGDVVELTAGPPAPDTAQPQILYDRAGLLIADKPPGILSNGPASLEQQLGRRLNRPRLTALHRLDRDTSGCLLLADDEDLRRAVIEQFAARRVTKIYHAIVRGRPDFDQREIRRQLDGQTALSRIMVLDAATRAAHLRVSIHTGRTHQIRRHLAALGIPLLGDRQYAAGRKLDQAEKPVPRQMLHARRLILRHPADGQAINVTAPLPADFRQTLRAMGLR